MKNYTETHLKARETTRELQSMKQTMAKWEKYPNMK